MGKIENAVRQMETWANDNSHGYDQAYRWGQHGDYDCSSAVITAWELAGVPVKSRGATYTGNMYKVFTGLGFSDVTSLCNLSTGAGLKRGDVLLNHVHHTAMYCGNGKEVEASINERGGATGGQPGDQTGKEFLIRAYRNYPWNCVLRYSGADAGNVSQPGKLAVDGSWGPATTRRTQQYLGTVIDGIVSNQPDDNRGYLPNAHISTWQFRASGYRQGSDMVRQLQRLIGATVDGWFGRQSVIALQRYLGVAQDGNMGPLTVKTWQSYLNKH